MLSGIAAYRRLLIHLGLAAACFGAFSPLRAAVDMFLKVEGVPGESMTSGHVNEIDVFSFSWGASNAGSIAEGGASSGIPADLSIVKYVDKSSPLLILKTFNGAHISTVTLFVRKAGATPFEFLKITLTDVLVSSVRMSGPGSDDRLTETVSFNFGRIEVAYTPQNANGSPGTVVRMGWNVTTNTAF